MNPSFAALIREKFKAARDLSPCSGAANDVDPSPLSTPPPSKKVSTTVPPLIRSTSGSTASNSSSNSDPVVVEPQTTMRHSACNGMQSLSVTLQIATITVMAWATKGNTFIREQATVCWKADFCDVHRDDGNVPEEIFIRSSPSDACSVVGEKETDVELMPMQLPRHSFYRKSHWNEIPEDPVDEVSLKGPSFGCSSDEEESVCFSNNTRKSRYSEI
jgi:hypothetical protein